MAELADALDLGSNITRCAGSSPVIRTMFGCDSELAGRSLIYYHLLL